MKSADLTLASSVVTVAEAAQILGISKPAIYQGLRNGRLKSWHEQGRRVMARDQLEARWWGSSQRPGGDHVGPRARSVAQRLNGFLGANWPAPPWDDDQLVTLLLCIELAQGGDG